MIAFARLSDDKFIPSVLLVICLFLIIQLMTVRSVQAQNVGIGTTTPGQKLEVEGNIKLDDHIMVEGSDAYRVYRNLASYSATGNTAGAFVIRTNMPYTAGCMWSATIKGYVYSSAATFELTVSAYNIYTNGGYIYSGDFDLNVRTGFETATGRVVIILGSEGTSYGWPKLTVTEFRAGHCTRDETRADGWDITQQTSLASYTAISSITNTTAMQWQENGSDVYRSSGNVGIGTATPAKKLHVQGGDLMVEDNYPFIYLVDTNTTGTNAGIQFQQNSTIKGYLYYDNANDLFRMYNELSSETDNLIIDSDGEVGIGTDAPTYKLDVRTSTEASGTRAIFGYNEATGTSASMHAIVGETRSSAVAQAGAGVIGINSATTGSGIGVKGEAYSPDARAVFGWATDISGTNYAIYGQTGSPNGYAGYFTGGRNYFEGSVGVGTSSPSYKFDSRINVESSGTRAIFGYNMATGTSSSMHAIVGETRSTATTQPGAGVIGINSASTGNGIGVKGEAYSPNAKGVYGWVTHTSGVNYAVHGKTDSPNGYAGYFEGGKNYFQGWVGIGTSSPTYRLDIYATNPSIRINGDAGSNNESLILSHNGTIKSWIWHHNTNGFLKFSNSSGGASPHLVIDASGHVGVGTETPGGNLHVNGDPTMGSIFVTPNESVSGDTAAIWLAEDNANDYGMGILYDGADNTLQIFGKDVSNEYGPHITIARNDGEIHFAGLINGGTDGPGINATTANITNGAVYGRFGTTGNEGMLGDDAYGVMANLHTADLGDYAIYGDGTDASTEDGTGYGLVQTLGGVKGYNFWGNPYTMGVAGYSYLDDNRSGGCFGGRSDGVVWGAMGYQSSGGTEYGSYYTSVGSGTGDHTGSSINIGLGAWGDLFGADIHGRVYGTFTEGNTYALYSKGHVFKNGLDVHLQDQGSDEMAVFYTHVSTDVTVQTSGFGTMSGGRSMVEFDENFKNIVSQEVPVIVTVTPMGRSNGIYLTEITPDGFTVEEDDEGRSNISFTYIAIGRRKGYENPQLPGEVVASDYTEKVARGLHNDNDLETDGEGLYYENGKLIVGRHTSTFPDPSKPSVPEGTSTSFTSPAKVSQPSADSGIPKESKVTHPAREDSEMKSSPSTGDDKEMYIEKKTVNASKESR